MTDKEMFINMTKKMKYNIFDKIIIFILKIHKKFYLYISNDKK
jgi:hypothetical protein